MTDKSLFSNLRRIGIAVRDLDKAIEHYESLGWGPFVKADLASVVDKTMYGKPYEWDLKVAVGVVAGLVIELVQPVDSPLHQNFLESHGEGVFHITFEVDDVKKVGSQFAEKGMETVLSFALASGGRGIYIDTGQVGGFVLEVVEGPSITRPATT